MLSKEQRTTIVELHKLGFATRAIQKAMQISRGAVRKVITAENPDPPQRERRR